MRITPWAVGDSESSWVLRNTIAAGTGVRDYALAWPHLTCAVPSGTLKHAAYRSRCRRQQHGGNGVSWGRVGDNGGDDDGGGGGGADAAVYIMLRILCVLLMLLHQLLVVRVRVRVHGFVCVCVCVCMRGVRVQRRLRRTRTPDN